MPDGYPVQVDVEYPDRPLNRLTTGLRIFTIIPIAIVLATVSGETWSWYGGNGATHAGRVVIVSAGGVLFAGPLLVSTEAVGQSWVPRRGPAPVS